MDALTYFVSLAIGLGILALSGAILFAVIEGGWWLIAKATGREY
jgi:hypothetical protein